MRKVGTIMRCIGEITCVREGIDNSSIWSKYSSVRVETDLDYPIRHQIEPVH